MLENLATIALAMKLGGMVLSALLGLVLIVALVVMCVNEARFRQQRDHDRWGGL